MMWSKGRAGLLRSATLASVAGLAVTAGGIASAGAASASSALTVKYKVTGSTFLKSVNTTATLGPGTLTSKVNLGNGKLTASLSLPAATVSFKEFGLVPVTATTEFVQDGPTTGRLNVSTGAVSTTSKIILKLTSMNVAGLPVPVPSGCQSAPATIKLASLKGFSVVNGGKLAGTYTIPKFAGCGLLTPVLNLTIPGSGNTIALKLGKAKRV
ncbi:MAG: hypothetical protein ACRDPO_20230 [Streptosporangiaceae bacterium]